MSETIYISLIDQDCKVGPETQRCVSLAFAPGGNRYHKKGTVQLLGTLNHCTNLSIDHDNAMLLLKFLCDDILDDRVVGT